MNKAVKSVDEYLEALPEAYRVVLQKLRTTIKSVAPEAEEVISYGMPGYKYHGPLVYMAAFKEHCSFFPGSSEIISRFDELKAYKTSKGTIQFTADKPIPASLVKKIVKARMEENERRDEARRLVKVQARKAVKDTKISKSKKPSEAEQVSIFMSKLSGAQFEDMEKVREIIRKASPKLNERIKWNAPSYYYKEDIVTFGPYKENKLLLVFHHPAVVKVKSGLLQGNFKDRRLVYFKDGKEATQNRKELTRIIREIIAHIETGK